MQRFLVLLLMAMVALACPAWAQQPHKDSSPEENNVAEIEELIATIQARV